MREEALMRNEEAPKNMAPLKRMRLSQHQTGEHPSTKAKPTSVGQLSQESKASSELSNVIGRNLALKRSVHGAQLPKQKEVGPKEQSDSDDDEEWSDPKDAKFVVDTSTQKKKSSVKVKVLPANNRVTTRAQSKKEQSDREKVQAKVPQEEEKAVPPTQSSPGLQSLQRRFGVLSFKSPATRMRGFSAERQSRVEHVQRQSLTPVIEEFSQMKIGSTPRRPRKSSLVQLSPKEVGLEEVPFFNE
jgi:hypothetical protein